MPAIRVLFLWHMHQPFYKDLVTGNYRLPWVRMHALKDYYGMVRLFDEFPGVHATFNLVPSLLAQVQDYAAGTAKDPALDVVSRPAAELSSVERELALRALFLANERHMIGKFPRYQELNLKYSAYHRDPARAERHFSVQDLADLQVLSQMAWCDEYYFERPDTVCSQLAKKGRDFTDEDRRALLSEGLEIIRAVIPAYRAAADKGQIELSTSPYYHPILPLLCDTDVGRESSAGLALPLQRFARPEDAAEQLRLALSSHQELFGKRPNGVWPSEGSVSEEVVRIAQRQGVRWMATDEGVLGRSLGSRFDRTSDGVLLPEGAHRLFNIYRYENGDSAMHLVFRDHALSDLIGFVYSGMPAREAAAHFLERLKLSARPVLAQGRDAVVPIILDGENAWEHFPMSGREFLRRMYDGLQSDPAFEALAVSECIERQKTEAIVPLRKLVPGSWIQANFNIWIGAAEDNRSWDCLSAARDAYAKHSAAVPEDKRNLAWQELLIAEGSDWNWWYGPEHSTANDRDFDELYRKHLANVYTALGLAPPEELAQPIRYAYARPAFHPQTAYIRPRIDGAAAGYFDWLGAAQYSADLRSAAMHGKTFLLQAAYLGQDAENLYCRVDFTDAAFQSQGDKWVLGDYELSVALRRTSSGGPVMRLRIAAELGASGLRSFTAQLLPEGADIGTDCSSSLEASVGRLFQVRLPLRTLPARNGDSILLRATLWKEKLPMDVIPAEGEMKLTLASEQELAAITSKELWKA